MKKYLLAVILCVSILSLTIWNGSKKDVDAATLTPGYSFATNEIVTAAKLATLVSGATLSSVTASDITDATITQAKMANNSIGTLQILDANVTGTKIAARTITGGLVATNAIGGTELSTNITYGAGTQTYSVGSIVNYTNASLVYTNGQIPLVAVSGAISSASKAAFQTNLQSNVTLGTSGTSSNLLTYTTTLGSNSVIMVNVYGTAAASGGTLTSGVRIGPNLVATHRSGVGSGTGLPGSHVSYTMLLVSNVVVTGVFASDDVSSTVLVSSSSVNTTNATGMSVMEVK